MAKKAKTEVEPVKEEKEVKKKLTQAAYEEKVMELAKTGLTSEKIGEKLRREGVHPKDYSKKISQILGAKYISPDLTNIETKYNGLVKHFAANAQDKRAKREKDRFFSKMRRIKQYLGLIK